MSGGTIRHDFVDAINILADSSKDAYAVIKGWLDVCDTGSASEVSITVTGPNGPETLTVPNLAKAIASVSGAGTAKEGTSFKASDPEGATGYEATLSPKMLSMMAYGKDAAYRGHSNDYFDLRVPLSPMSSYPFFSIPRYLMVGAGEALDTDSTHTVSIGTVPAPGELPVPRTGNACLCCEMDVSNGLPAPITVKIQKAGTTVPLLALTLSPGEHANVFVFGWAGYDTINVTRK